MEQYLGLSLHQGLKLFLVMIESEGIRKYKNIATARKNEYARNFVLQNNAF